jgi:hypothetical protein
MINKSNTSRILSFSLLLVGLVLLRGQAEQVNAQNRDPFLKPGYMKQNTATQSTGKGGKIGSSLSPEAPSIEQRIEYYKRLREQAASSGSALPKVTSVLTLNEMAVTGIFHTPRGYAAMVEAVPIKLSYTIYPGERFFDGQLVAVEENRLIFRRVTKSGSGKFVSSVENKSLRQFSTKAQLEGTAPTQSSDRTIEQASVNTQPSADKKDLKAPVQIVSPLDEMNKQPKETEKEKSGKNAKKPAKVAKNR